MQSWFVAAKINHQLIDVAKKKKLFRYCFIFLQFCIRLHGIASADEHQAGDRTETVQWSLDAQRRAARKFLSS